MRGTPACVDDPQAGRRRKPHSHRAFGVSQDGLASQARWRSVGAAFTPGVRCGPFFERSSVAASKRPASGRDGRSGRWSAATAPASTTRQGDVSPGGCLEDHVADPPQQEDSGEPGPCAGQPWGVDDVVGLVADDRGGLIAGPRGARIVGPTVQVGLTLDDVSIVADPRPDRTTATARSGLAVRLCERAPDPWLREVKHAGNKERRDDDRQAPAEHVAQELTAPTPPRAPSTLPLHIKVVCRVRIRRTRFSHGRDSSWSWPPRRTASGNHRSKAEIAQAGKGGTCGCMSQFGTYQQDVNRDGRDDDRCWAWFAEVRILGWMRMPSRIRRMVNDLPRPRQ